ncbi:hypothetical protein [Maricaulis sp.]|uniref:hypothetical protein n=1 Tax=Maricaulis sp. TaxID=1486257 RepID=UPI00262A3728|nr:hypothetical protein [Maricaulis sp.]
MARTQSSVRTFMKFALLWLTLGAVAASLYGGLLASQDGPRSLHIAQTETANPVLAVADTPGAN